MKKQLNFYTLLEVSKILGISYPYAVKKRKLCHFPNAFQLHKGGHEGWLVPKRDVEKELKIKNTYSASERKAMRRKGDFS